MEEKGTWGSEAREEGRGQRVQTTPRDEKSEKVNGGKGRRGSVDGIGKETEEGGRFNVYTALGKEESRTGKWSKRGR